MKINTTDINGYAPGISDAPSDGNTYGRKNAAWASITTTVVWGSITGTLSAQTDLQTALNAKEPTITAGTTAQYWRGDKTWQTLPAPGISDAPSDGNTYGRLNAAWANLNLSQYAQLSGAVFTGGIAMSGVLTVGAASNPLSLINIGVYGSITYDSSAVTTIYGQNFYYSSGYKARVTGQAAGMRFGNPGVEFFYNSTVTANTSFTPNITATFNASSAVFSVPLTAPTYYIDTQFYMTLLSGKPTITFDSGDYVQYDRTANKLYLYIGGTAVMSVDASGNIRALGTITPSVTP